MPHLTVEAGAVPGLSRQLRMLVRLCWACKMGWIPLGEQDRKRTPGKSRVFSARMDMPIIPALWEAKVGRSLEARSSRLQ